MSAENITLFTLDIWGWKEKVYEEMNVLSIEERIISFRKASVFYCDATVQ